MNESKHKKKYKVAPSISYTPPIFKIWTKEQLFAMDCVASVYTKDIAGLSIPQLKDYIQNTCKSVKLNPQFVYSRHHIGNLVSHRAVNKEMKKVVMSSVPYVLNNGHPITKWAYKPNPQNPIDRMQSCLYGAPIMINDVKYLCLLTIKFNNITGKIFPYVVNIEDENGMKVSDDISVLDNNDATTPSNSGTSTGTVTSQDSRAPSNPTANVQQNIETNKNNDIKTENKQYKTNRNMKHRVRLTESDLHSIVKESVKKVLNEVGNTTKGQYMLGRLAARKKNLTDRQKIGDYAHQKRMEIHGDDEPQSKFLGPVENPMQSDYLQGMRDYDYAVNPNNEWDEGYWDDEEDIWKPDIRRGGKEEEKRQAQNYLKGDEERWQAYRNKGAKF